MYVQLYERGGEFVFDDDELRRAFSEKTKAIVINTPHNPTGKVFNRAELEFIGELCQENSMRWRLRTSPTSTFCMTARSIAA